MQITEEALIVAGYKQYIDYHNFKNADTAFQKCVCDKIGKKYFIDVYGYNASKYPQWKLTECNTTGWSYMFVGSFSSKRDSGFIFQPNHSSRDLESIEHYEELFENVWNKLKPDYYERYDE